MPKKIVSTPLSAPAIGPYSQAVEINQTLYVSGQIAIDPATGILVQTTVSDEIHQVMKNLQAILHAAGYTFDHVVKATVFLNNLNLYEEFNKVYNTYFKGDYPAREAVVVAALPKNVRVEISMIAAK